MKGSSVGAALFTALLCIGCGQPASPTGPAAAGGSLSLDSAARGGGQGTAAAQSVPFQGNLEGSQTVTPITPPLALVEGTATGTSPHLGRFVVGFPHTVNFATASGVGTYTFTAANGDVLTADFTGQAQRGTVTTIVEQATITGGTGRFVGATGSFTVHRIFDPVTGLTSGSFEGTISAPGAGKP